MTPSHLVPTPVVDKNGRHTTVLKKHLSGAVSNDKGLPAPSIQKSPNNVPKELIERVLWLFPDKYGEMLRGKISGLSDESLISIGQAAEKAKILKSLNADMGAFAGIINEAQTLGYPEGFYPYLNNAIDEIGGESLRTIFNVYRGALSEEKVPASDEVLASHVKAASMYFDMAIAANYEMEFSYTSNKPLFELVVRHPEKVDVIMRNYTKYRPEENGVDELERDLDTISEIANPVSDGWL